MVTLLSLILRSLRFRRVEKCPLLITAPRGGSGYKVSMLMGKIYGDKLPTGVREPAHKPVARIGLGGALETTSAKNRRLGGRLAWGSFWAMTVVVAMIWVRWGLMALGLDFSNGIAGLEMTMLFLGALAVMVSHLLVFVCDTLTAGDAGPAAWALAIFWGGVVVGPFLFSALELLL